MTSDEGRVMLQSVNIHFSPYFAQLPFETTIKVCSKIGELFPFLKPTLIDVVKSSTYNFPELLEISKNPNLFSEILKTQLKCMNELAELKQRFALQEIQNVDSTAEILKLQAEVERLNILVSLYQNFSSIEIIDNENLEITKNMK